MKNEWHEISSSYHNVLEVMSLNTLGLVRNTFYDESGSFLSSNLIEIDYETAAHLVRKIKSNPEYVELR